VAGLGTVIPGVQCGGAITGGELAALPAGALPVVLGVVLPPPGVCIAAPCFGAPADPVDPTAVDPAANGEVAPPSRMAVVNRVVSVFLMMGILVSSSPKLFAVGRLTWRERLVSRRIPLFFAAGRLVDLRDLLSARLVGRLVLAPLVSLDSVRMPSTARARFAKSGHGYLDSTIPR
jgi:hypothetical protein